MIACRDAELNHVGIAMYVYIPVPLAYSQVARARGENT